MKKFLAAVFLFLLMVTTSIAQTPPSATLSDIATSSTTFAVCKVADVASTIYLVNSGIGSEANGIVAWLNGLGLGWAPFIVVSYGVYWLIDSYSTPAGTAAANIITCGAALRNLTLIP